MNRTNYTLASIEFMDCKEAAVALNTAVNSLQIVGKITKLNGGNPLTEDDWQHFFYSVAFHWEGRGLGKKMFTILLPWKTGMAVKKVNPAEVLAYACADYLSTIFESFEEWAADFGYDEDSRKAEKIYRQCEELGKQLKKFGLSGDEIAILGRLANML